MAGGIDFMINIQTKNPGAAATTSSLANLERAMRRSAKTIRALEAGQKRLNKAGQLSSDQYRQLASAKGGLQSKLSAQTAQFAKLAAAESKVASESRKVAQGFAAVGRAIAKQKAASDKWNANVQASATRMRSQMATSRRNVQASTSSARGLSGVLGEMFPRISGITSRLSAMGGTGVGAFAAMAVGAAAVVYMYYKLAKAALRVGVAIAKVILPTAAWAEKTKMALGLLLKSNSAGAAAFTKIGKLAADLGLEVQATVDQFKKLLAMQFSVGEAEDVIKMAADMKALGATAQEVQAIVRAITQIKGKGVLQMEELQQQLAETGISTALVLGQLSKALGKPTDEIRKMISAGKINAKVGIEAIENAAKQKMGIKELGDAAKMAAGTLGGLWDRMTSTFTNLKIAIANKLLPVLTKFLAPAMERLLAWMKTPQAGKAFDKIVAVLGTLTRWLGIAAQMLGGFVEGVGRGIGQVDALGSSAGELSAARIQELVSSAVAFGEAVGRALGAVVALIDKLSELQVVGSQSFAGDKMDLVGMGMGSGQGVGQGMANGIRQSTPLAVAAAQDMASQVSAAVKSGLNLGSPSKLMAQYGRWTGEGFGEGLDASAPGAAASMSALVTPHAPGKGGSGSKGGTGPVTIYITAGDSEDVARKVRAVLDDIAESITIEVGAGPEPEAVPA